MAYELIEKKRFVAKLSKLLVYLENEWRYDTAKKFLEKIDMHLSLIKEQTFVGVQTAKKNIRSVLVTKHNRLFYKISGNKIILLNLYDTRINPTKNPYKKI